MPAWAACSASDSGDGKEGEKYSPKDEYAIANQDYFMGHVKGICTREVPLYLDESQGVVK